MSEKRLAEFVAASHMRSVPTSKIFRGISSAPDPLQISGDGNSGDDNDDKGNIIP